MSGPHWLEIVLGIRRRMGTLGLACGQRRWLKKGQGAAHRAMGKSAQHHGISALCEHVCYMTYFEKHINTAEGFISWTLNNKNHKLIVQFEHGLLGLLQFKVPQTGWSKTAGICYPTVLGTRNLETKMSEGGFLLRDLRGNLFHGSLLSSSGRWRSWCSSACRSITPLSASITTWPSPCLFLCLFLLFL